MSTTREEVTDRRRRGDDSPLGSPRFPGGATGPGGQDTGSERPAGAQRALARVWQQVYPPALLLLALVALWEAAIRWGHATTRILPSPGRVVSAGWTDRATIVAASRLSLRETLLGLALGIAASLLFAVGIEAFAPFRRSVYPLLVGSQTVPVVALAPLLVLWFGFGILPKVLLVALYGFFPLVVGLVGGMASTPRAAVDLMRTIGVTRWRVVVSVKLPHALPQFFSGLRVAASYALGTAVVAEFLGSFDGLGIYLLSAKASFRTDLVFAAAVVIVALTLVVFGLVVALEHLLLPWSRLDVRPS